MKIVAAAIAALQLLHLGSALERPQSYLPHQAKDDDITSPMVRRRGLGTCQQELSTCEAVLETINVQELLDSNILSEDHYSPSHKPDPPHPNKDGPKHHSSKPPPPKDGPKHHSKPPHHHDHSSHPSRHSDSSSDDKHDLMDGKWGNLFFLEGALKSILESIFYMSGVDVKLSGALLIGIPFICVVYRLIIRRLFPQLLLPNISKFFAEVEFTYPFLEAILSSDGRSGLANATNTTNTTPPEETLEEFRKHMHKSKKEKSLVEEIDDVIKKLDEIIFYLEPLDLAQIIDLVFHLDPTEFDGRPVFMTLTAIPVIVLSLHMVIQRLFPELSLTHLFPFLHPVDGDSKDYADATMDELRVVLSDSLDKGQLDLNRDQELFNYIFFLEEPLKGLFGRDGFDEESGRILGFQVISTVLKGAMKNISPELAAAANGSSSAAEKADDTDLSALVQADATPLRDILKPIAKVIRFLAPGIVNLSELLVTGGNNSTANSEVMNVPTLFAATQLTIHRIFPRLEPSRSFPILQQNPSGDGYLVEFGEETCRANLAACTTTLGTAEALFELSFYDP